VADTMSRGSMTIVPGSTPHAGPECEKYRVVLFFEIRTTKEVGPYNNYNQQNAAGLWADFFHNLFFHLTLEDQKWLVQKVLDLRPKHVGFSLHIRGDVGVFFLNLEEACHIKDASQIEKAKREIIDTFCRGKKNFIHGYCRRPGWVKVAQQLENPSNATKTRGFRHNNKQFCVGDKTKGVPKQWLPSFDF